MMIVTDSDDDLSILVWALIGSKIDQVRFQQLRPQIQQIKSLGEGITGWKRFSNDES